MNENKGELNISVTSQNGHHLVSIKDNGTVSARKPCRIYLNLILRSKETDSDLGLATTLNIIQSHKASIDVQTGIDQGSNFILKFERA